MNKEKLDKEILKLLETSTISKHDKNMVEILLPTMSIEITRELHAILKREKKDMGDIEKKEERVVLQHKILVDNLNRASRKP